MEQITGNDIMNHLFNKMIDEIETFEMEDKEDLQKFLRTLYMEMIITKERFNILYK